MRGTLIFLLLWPAFLWSQSAQEITKDKDRYVFGQIFAEFRYCFDNEFKPPAAFNFNQGILGYYHRISDNVSGKIMFDVTRTTHIYDITDSAGSSMNVDYFEGSKYTAYLKMAEIRWDFHEYLTFRVGQLLNTQYLTFQDPFWGYRYIDVTFQERFRFGMPADFGVQLDFHYKGRLLNQFSVVNGEGPFRYQDINGKFIYSNNIQYSPFENLTLKFYADYGPSPDTSSACGPKAALSGFAGYKTGRFRVGAEYDYVFNYAWIRDEDHSGISVFASLNVTKKLDVMARYDHLTVKMPGVTRALDYYIVGAQYEPAEFFTTSLNFRYISEESLPFIFASFGLKF